LIAVQLLDRPIVGGVVADARQARTAVSVRDRPGHLARLTRLVADEGANVLEVAHRRAFADIGVGDVEIIVHLETRGRVHMDAVLDRLRREGLAVREEVQE
jgi:threonine dehydratase